MYQLPKQVCSPFASWLQCSGAVVDCYIWKNLMLPCALWWTAGTYCSELSRSNTAKGTWSKNITAEKWVSTSSKFPSWWKQLGLSTITLKALCRYLSPTNHVAFLDAKEKRVSTWYISERPVKTTCPCLESVFNYGQRDISRFTHQCTESLV